MKAAEKVTAARTALILDQPFFGALSLRLAILEDPTCPTAWVDGKTLGYNPRFVEGLTHAEILGLIAHEVMHCACGHPWRRDNRDPKKWNIAADYAINAILVDAGFQLPEGGLLDSQWDGKSAEWIFDRLPNQGSGSKGSQRGQKGGSGDDQASGRPGDQDGQGSAGAGQGDAPGAPGGPDNALGEVRDAPTDADARSAEATEADWKRATQEAARAAQVRGTVPGSLKRFADERKRSRVDWKSVLRRFVQSHAKNDYSWTRPNKRFMARGLYLPALHSEEMGPIVAAVDTSGSIDSVLLSQFASEIQGIADEMQPEKVVVMYCDARVHRVDVFERGEAIEMAPCGGGGTDFRPVFRKLADLDEVPVCVVYLTDLYGTFPDTEPETPTLWVSPTRGYTVPFGEYVEVDR